jgi:hypothetical protein
MRNCGLTIFQMVSSQGPQAFLYVNHRDCSRVSEGDLTQIQGSAETVSGFHNEPLRERNCGNTGRVKVSRIRQKVTRFWLSPGCYVRDATPWRHLNHA